MRILHVIPWLHTRYGGPVSALFGLAAAQAEIGLEPRILATDPEHAGPALEPTLRARGVSMRAIHPVSGPLLRSPRIRELVSDACKEADVIHIHALYEELQHQAAREAGRLQKPYVIRPCGMLDPWSLAQSKWKKKLYFAWRLRRNLREAAALHFTTEIERDLAAPLALGTRALVVPNGIRLEDFRLEGENPFLSKHPQLASKRVVAYLGRLLPTKGLDLLIDAFKTADLRACALVIAGPGEKAYVDQLRTRAGESVVFTGLLEGSQKIGLLHAAALFVLPSHHENFGNVIFEALACGTPALISDQVQVHREIVSGGVGEVFPLNEAALAAGLKKWVDSDKIRCAAKARIGAFLQRFAWREIARRWKEEYQKLTE